MPSKPCDVVGLGVIAVDDMLFVDSYPPANMKVRVRERRRQGGGTMSCGLAAAGRLGSRCRALGRLGQNELSEFVHQNLGRFGIDLSYLVCDPPAEPVYCVIVVAADTGSRAIYGDYTHAGVLQPDELRAEWFAGAKVLLIDHFGPPTILAGAKLAKKAGLQVVSDIERNSPEFAETRQYIDHLVCSAEFAVPYTQSETPAAACEALERTGRHSTVVVTAGEHGCFYCTAEDPRVKQVRAHSVKAVDTTGCGDVFHGVFCHGLAAGWPIEKVIAWANAGAAIKASRTGGWMAVPTAEEIEQMLKT
jgi:sulfofructose kinase